MKSGYKGRAEGGEGCQGKWINKVREYWSDRVGSSRRVWCVGAPEHREMETLLPQLPPGGNRMSELLQ